jgi:hypothetical protein
MSGEFEHAKCVWPGCEEPAGPGRWWPYCGGGCAWAEQVEITKRQFASGWVGQTMDYPRKPRRPRARLGGLRA